MTPNGPNQGLSPLAQGVWTLINPFQDGRDIPVQFLADGTILGDAVVGLWNTDHNPLAGISQPPAAIFYKVSDKSTGLTFKAHGLFSATPIVLSDDGRSTLTSYAYDLNRGLLTPTSKKVAQGIIAFQLYANTE